MERTRPLAGTARPGALGARSRAGAATRRRARRCAARSDPRERSRSRARDGGDRGQRARRAAASRCAPARARSRLLVGSHQRRDRRALAGRSRAAARARSRRFGRAAASRCARCTRAWSSSSRCSRGWPGEVRSRSSRTPACCAHWASCRHPGTRPCDLPQSARCGRRSRPARRRSRRREPQRPTRRSACEPESVAATPGRCWECWRRSADR